jgi:hypothetical protein
MNIPVIVDVAIGLIFIYLILSLLASEILELIATVLQWRAQHLRQAIINLLAGDTITDQNIEAAKRLTKDLYNHPLLNDLNQEARGLFATLFRKITWVFSWVYQWITGGEGVFGNKVTGPSYIPGETFATALIERLGVAKLVEPLIEAKFNRFINSIIENVGSLIGCSNILKSEALAGLIKTPSEPYEVLQVKLYEIYKHFSEHKLTLIAAIDKISLRIDLFIQAQNDKQKQDELKLWKRGLFGKQNELAIVNGGLKPTLEEVADLVNLSSRTYQSFKEEFETYYEQRNKDVAEKIEDFVLVFDSIIRIIINVTNNKNDKNAEFPFPSFKEIQASSEHKAIWATDLTSFNSKNRIYPLFEPKVVPTSPESQTNSTPTSPESEVAPTSSESQTNLTPTSPESEAAPTSSESQANSTPTSPESEVAPTSSESQTNLTPTSPESKAAPTSSEPKIAISLTRLDEEFVRIIKNFIDDKGIENYRNAKNNLKAFKEGFGEEGQELLGSKLALRWREKNWWVSVLVPLVVALFLLFPFFFWRGLFITPVGGILSALFIVILFIVFLLFNREPQPKKWGDKEILSNVLEDYFFPVDLTPSNNETSKIKTFRNNFKGKIQNLKSEDESHLRWELSRMGQSLRQYHRALVLNNADVDLLFVPSSVKWSVASLVRRTETKIDRAGNEVNQLREEVEIWFDRSMDRSSGVYKRNARGITILIGFLLAVVTNSDSIYIVNRLASDQEIRQAVVQGAERFIASENQPSPSASPTSLTEDQLRDRSQRVSQLLNEQLALPIGWNARVLGRQLGCELSENARDEYWQKLFDKCISPKRNEDGTLKDPFDDIYIKEADRNYTKAQELYKKVRLDRQKMNKPKDYFFPTAFLAMMWTLGKWQVGLLFLLGWFVTAIAISMGATFWFDLLGKLVNVRNTGNRPPSSANQTSVNSEKTSE